MQVLLKNLGWKFVKILDIFGLNNRNDNGLETFNMLRIYDLPYMLHLLFSITKIVLLGED